MRVNIYAEELTDRVELIEKEIEGNKYVALRFYTELPVTVPSEAIARAACLSAPQMYRAKPTNFRGPFIDRPGDDDSSAVTFWGKRSMRNILQKALDLLDAHYNKHRDKYEMVEQDYGKAGDDEIRFTRTTPQNEPNEVYRPNLLSSTALSNLYTMGCTAKVDPRQELPTKSYVIPPIETRLLRARLIIEEAFETAAALGVRIRRANSEVEFSELDFVKGDEPDLEEIIDGCCDTQYVTIGTLVACGVPDEYHMEKVNKANNAKFPEGKAVANEHGKFQKPDGWKAPEHLNGAHFGVLNFKRKSEQLINDAQEGE